MSHALPVVHSLDSISVVTHTPLSLSCPHMGHQAQRLNQIWNQLLAKSSLQASRSDLDHSDRTASCSASVPRQNASRKNPCFATSAHQESSEQGGEAASMRGSFVTASELQMEPTLPRGTGIPCQDLTNSSVHTLAVPHSVAITASPVAPFSSFGQGKAPHMGIGGRHLAHSGEECQETCCTP